MKEELKNKEKEQEEKKCTCGDDCNCTEEKNCGCGGHHKHKHHDDCACEGKHEHECDCEEDCCCDENCECEHEQCSCNEQVDLAGQYLAMAQRLQADFDNYRKKVAEQLDWQREEGKRSVIEAFLPALDTFKEAKKSISDESVLAGINMIEDKITNALKKLNVEKIEAIGKVYDHNLHEVIAVLKDEQKENDIILDEFQAGYIMNGKVIRYSKVVVNKLA